MSEEMNAAAATAADPAQTSGQSPQTAVAGGGQNDGNVNDAAFADTARGDEGTPSGANGEKADKGEGKKPQSKDTNAEFARKRREAERQRELTETRNNAIIEALGGKNPYTDGDMKDADDVEEFLAMRAIEKKGGDPVTDYSKHMKEQSREKRERERTEAEQRKWYADDRAAFAAKYPDADLSALIEDESFRIFAEGKVGERPLAEIYENYLAMTGALEQRANRKAAQAVANGKASPGALSGAGRVESDFFTRDQVKAMTPAQIDANYDKIRASMAKW